ncbi:MAG: hypothetical protein DRJ03_18490 [Chloroflexi bacterium]|nr:MAG: hypothetical protein DRJ03_18490 [Chloroflexota bacterium]
MPDETPQEQEVQPQENKVEKRINQLYGEKKEAQELAETLRSENTELRSQFLGLQEKVAGLEAAQPAPQQTQEPQAGTQISLSGGDVGNIRDIVQEAVGQALTQRDAQAQNVNQLKQSHVNSWAKAIKEMPALKDQNTDIYKAANEIFLRDTELQKSYEGPFKAALMAKGIVGGDGATAEQLNAATQGSATQSIGSINAGKDLETAKAEFDEAKTELSNGAPYQIWYPRYTKARVKYNTLLKEKGK